jgi:hypothetical protein
MTTVTRTHVYCFFLLLLGIVISSVAQAQPKTLKELQLANERMYRDLNNMDDKGGSYQFTNVIAWHIQDDSLRSELIRLYTDLYGENGTQGHQFKSFNPEDVYVFSVPLGNERYMPFHLLFKGKRVQASAADSSASDIAAELGIVSHKASGKPVFIAFKGKDVIRPMLRQPSIVDDISAIQGETVELPGDIAPRGAQLIKSSDERYIFHEMFVGPYSKKVIVNEQSRYAGGPTMDEIIDISVDTTIPQLQPEADQTVGATAEVLNSRAFRFQPRFDISIDHLAVNISRQNQIEVQLGNPEVGLPFWASGEGRLWLNMRNQIGTGSDFKLGLDFPLNLGRQDGLTFQARKLSGFWGGSLAAYFSGVDFFSAFNMPLAFNFSFIPAGGSNSSIIYNGTYLVGGDPTSQLAVPTFYRTSFIGQLYVPFIVQLNQTNFMQFSAGVGIHQVKLSWIPKDTMQTSLAGLGADQVGTVQDLLYNGKTNVSTPFTPHVAIELVNHMSNKFGLNFQYDHLFTFGGWLELVPDHLRVEASYTAPLVRDPLPYEPKYFFEITPRLYF